MTKQEQEALSYKYSNSIIILLKLSTGELAVFNNARQLLGIVPDIQNVEVFVKQKPLQKPVKRALLDRPSVTSFEEAGI